MSESNDATPGPAPHADEARLRMQVARVAIVAAVVGGLLAGTAAIVVSVITSRSNSATAQVQLIRTQQQAAYAKFIADHEAFSSHLDAAYQELSSKSPPTVDELTVSELKTQVDAIHNDYSVMSIDVDVIQIIGSESTYRAARDARDSNWKSWDALRKMLAQLDHNSGSANDYSGYYHQGTSGAATAMYEVFIPSAKNDLGTAGE